MKLFDLSGKVAIVTGGNGGIGLGIAHGLAQSGASVAIVGRDHDKSVEAARQLAEEMNLLPHVVTADVSHEADCLRIVEEVLDRFGRIDILFNNAGVSIRRPPEEFSLDDWRKVIDINLTGAFLLSKAVYPALKAAGGGKIVNIGSLASIFGSSYAAAYAASKGGIVQLTKSLALAWARDNIQVNAILPGWFETEMTHEAREYVPGLYERVLARVPLGRWATAADMAGTAIWLAAPASDYVTGIAVAVDGGYLAMP